MSSTLNIVGVVVLVFFSLLGQGKGQWSPNVELLEIISTPSDNGNNGSEIIRPVRKPKNSEIVVGRDVNPQSRLIIKCNATFPVQIVYIGAGRPEFTTFTNVQWREDPQMPLTFEAEATLGLLGFQGTLRAEDSGNFTCRSIQNASILSYFYIFVPGPSLFTTPDGYNSQLYFTQKDKQILIPCASGHPDATVSLYKMEGGKLQCPGLGRNVASYDPHRGFLLNLKDSGLRRPEGVYLCIGSLNENYRVMQYNLALARGDGIDLENGKGPCRPSPCGQRAECVVMDGQPVCYCGRGLNGNPYTECGKGSNGKDEPGGQVRDRCTSSGDCKVGEVCSNGKCTVDPCKPSRCGKGATCVSQNGRPRCQCQPGYEGTPPYCLKRCTHNGECLHNEVCSRSRCSDPCPGRCGKNADCQVVQAGHNRTVLCTCPPGRTGDPHDDCYDVGRPPRPIESPNSQCPVGFIGPGPPYCRRKECDDNFDCPSTKYCSAEKKCVDKGSCEVCGEGAICELPRSSVSRPICRCPGGTTGDPWVKCENVTKEGDREPEKFDPCDPNPCPPGTACKVRDIEGRSSAYAHCERAKVPAAIPASPGQHGFQCYDDSECPRGEECVGRLCLPPKQQKEPAPSTCRRKCGANAFCSGTACVCPEGLVGNPEISCAPERDPCVPSPCSDFAECRVINGRAACRCILGYEGDAFNQCTPIPTPASPSSTRFLPNRAEPAERERENPQKCFTDKDCDPSEVCLRSPEGHAKCVCTSGSCGYEPPPDQDVIPVGVAFGRYCSQDGHCRHPEVCSKQRGVCFNPCGYENSPCARVKNSECRVVEGRALCTCKRGFVGSPQSGLDCRRDEFPEPSQALVLAGGASEGGTKRVSCNLERGTGCDTRSECRPSDDGNGEAFCFCGSGFTGNYPDCRLKCKTNRDCYNAQECWKNECVDPCKRNGCGVGAICRVINHRAQCDCKVGHTGDPWIKCYPTRRERGLELKYV